MKLPELSKDQSRIVEPYLLQALNDANDIIVAVPRVYMYYVKDVEIAVYLSQIVYWYTKQYRGEFYKTDSEMLEIFPLKSIDHWKRIKKVLKTLPFLSIEARGMPPKTYYNVNYVKLVEEMSRVFIDENVENP